MLNLFFPITCLGCEQPLLKSEKLICSSCRHELPLLPQQDIINSKMRSLFYGRIPVEIAFSLLKDEKANRHHTFISRGQN